MCFAVTVSLIWPLCLQRNRSVFVCSKTVIMGLYPARGMAICLRISVEMEGADPPYEDLQNT
jgi:hypothetical protein